MGGASVVATIIGHNKEKGWVLVDAGWMALSSDRGTADQEKDCGYGLVATREGKVFTDLQVITVNQEHGIIAATGDAPVDFDAFPIGSRVHILPNHACAMTAMHTHYHVFDPETGQYEKWTRVLGW